MEQHPRLTGLCEEEEVNTSQSAFRGAATATDGPHKLSKIDPTARFSHTPASPLVLKRHIHPEPLSAERGEPLSSDP